jgi:transcription elongation factor Elf1
LQDDPDWAKIDTCPHCNNLYVVLWLRHGNDWNDLGFRHCPFCGLAFDQVTGAMML